MISIFLTFALLAIAVFGVRERKMSAMVGASLLALSAVGLLFVWIPGAADAFAHFVGVGRGADLVLYVYCGVSFLLILNLSLKLRAQHETLTKLARHIAIAEAERDVTTWQDGRL